MVVLSIPGCIRSLIEDRPRVNVSPDSSHGMLDDLNLDGISSSSSRLQSSRNPALSARTARTIRLENSVSRYSVSGRSVSSLELPTPSPCTLCSCHARAASRSSQASGIRPRLMDLRSAAIALSKVCSKRVVISNGSNHDSLSCTASCREASRARLDGSSIISPPNQTKRVEDSSCVPVDRSVHVSSTPVVVPRCSRSSSPSVNRRREPSDDASTASNSRRNNASRRGRKFSRLTRSGRSGPSTAGVRTRQRARKNRPSPSSVLPDEGDAAELETPNRDRSQSRTSNGAVQCTSGPGSDAAHETGIGRTEEQGVCNGVVSDNELVVVNAVKSDEDIADCDAEQSSLRIEEVFTENGHPSSSSILPSVEDCGYSGIAAANVLIVESCPPDHDKTYHGDESVIVVNDTVNDGAMEQEIIKDVARDNESITDGFNSGKDNADHALEDDKESSLKITEVVTELDHPYPDSILPGAQDYSGLADVVAGASSLNVESCRSDHVETCHRDSNLDSVHDVVQEQDICDDVARNDEGMAQVTVSCKDNAEHESEDDKQSSLRIADVFTEDSHPSSTKDVSSGAFLPRAQGCDDSTVEVDEANVEDVASCPSDCGEILSIDLPTDGVREGQGDGNDSRIDDKQVFRVLNSSEDADRTTSEHAECAVDDEKRCLDGLSSVEVSFKEEDVSEMCSRKEQSAISSPDKGNDSSECQLFSTGGDDNSMDAPAAANAEAGDIDSHRPELTAVSLERDSMSASVESIQELHEDMTGVRQTVNDINSGQLGTALLKIFRDILNGQVVMADGDSTQGNQSSTHPALGVPRDNHQMIGSSSDNNETECSASGASNVKRPFRFHGPRVNYKRAERVLGIYMPVNRNITGFNFEEDVDDPPPLTQEAEPAVSALETSSRSRVTENGEQHHQSCTVEPVSGSDPENRHSDTCESALDLSLPVSDDDSFAEVARVANGSRGVSLGEVHLSNSSGNPQCVNEENITCRPMADHQQKQLLKKPYTFNSSKRTVFSAANPSVASLSPVTVEGCPPRRSSDLSISRFSEKPCASGDYPTKSDKKYAPFISRTFKFSSGSGVSFCPRQSTRSTDHNLHIKSGSGLPFCPRQPMRAADHNLHTASSSSQHSLHTNEVSNQNQIVMSIDNPQYKHVSVSWKSCRHFARDRIFPKGVVNFLCGVCQWICSPWASFLQHMRTHSGEETLICAVCWEARSSVEAESAEGQISIADTADTATGTNKDGSKISSSDQVSDHQLRSFPGFATNQVATLAAANYLGKARGKSTPIFVAPRVSCSHFADGRFCSSDAAKLFICGVCEVVGIRWHEFIAHMSIHAGEGLLVCSQCTDVFQESTPGGVNCAAAKHCSDSAVVVSRSQSSEVENSASNEQRASERQSDDSMGDCMNIVDSEGEEPVVSVPVTAVESGGMSSGNLDPTVVRLSGEGRSTASSAGGSTSCVPEDVQSCSQTTDNSTLGRALCVDTDRPPGQDSLSVTRQGDNGDENTADVLSNSGQAAVPTSEKEDDGEVSVLAQILKRPLIITLDQDSDGEADTAATGVRRSSRLPRRCTRRAQTASVRAAYGSEDEDRDVDDSDDDSFVLSSDDSESASDGENGTTEACSGARTSVTLTSTSATLTAAAAASTPSSATYTSASTPYLSHMRDLAYIRRRHSMGPTIGLAMRASGVSYVRTPSVSALRIPNMSVVRASNVSVVRVHNMSVVRAPNVSVVRVHNMSVVRVPNMSVVRAPNVPVVGVPNLPVVRAPNVSVVGAPNVSVVRAPHMSVVRAPHMSVVRAPNVSVVRSPNVSVVRTPNVSVVGAPNVSAGGAPNVSAVGAPNVYTMQRPSVSSVRTPNMHDMRRALNTLYAMRTPNMASARTPDAWTSKYRQFNLIRRMKRQCDLLSPVRPASRSNKRSASCFLESDTTNIGRNKQRVVISVSNPKYKHPRSAPSKSCSHFDRNRFFGSKTTFRCGFCGAVYTVWARYLEHMQLHTGEDAIICKQCWQERSVGEATGEDSGQTAMADVTSACAMETSTDEEQSSSTDVVQETGENRVSTVVVQGSGERTSSTNDIQEPEERLSSTGGVQVPGEHSISSGVGQGSEEDSISTDGVQVPDEHSILTDVVQVSEEHSILTDVQVSEEHSIFTDVVQVSEEHSISTDGVQVSEEQSILTDIVQVSEEQSSSTDGVQVSEEQSSSTGGVQVSEEQSSSTGGVQVSEEHSILTDIVQVSEEHSILTDVVQVSEEHSILTDVVQVSEEHSISTDGVQVSEEHSSSTGGVLVSEEHSILTDVQVSEEQSSSTGGVQVSKERSILTDAVQVSEEQSSSTGGVQVSEEHSILTDVVQVSEEQSSSTGGDRVSEESMTFTSGDRLSQENLISTSGVQGSEEHWSSTGGVQESEENMVLTSGDRVSEGNMILTSGDRVSEENMKLTSGLQGSEEHSSSAGGVQRCEEHSSSTGGVQVPEEHSISSCVGQGSVEDSSSTGGVQLPEEHSISSCVGQGSVKDSSSTGGVQLPEEHSSSAGGDQVSDENSILTCGDQVSEDHSSSTGGDQGSGEKSISTGFVQVFEEHSSSKGGEQGTDEQTSSISVVQRSEENFISAEGGQGSKEHSSLVNDIQYTEERSSSTGVFQLSEEHSSSAPSEEHSSSISARGIQGLEEHSSSANGFRRSGEHSSSKGGGQLSEKHSISTDGVQGSENHMGSTGGVQVPEEHSSSAGSDQESNEHSTDTVCSEENPVITLVAANCYGKARDDRTPMFVARKPRENTCRHLRDDRFFPLGIGREFNCGVCGMVFRQWSKFVLHVGLHVGDGPLVCSHCGDKEEVSSAATVDGNATITTSCSESIEGSLEARGSVDTPEVPINDGELSSGPKPVDDTSSIGLGASTSSSTRDADELDGNGTDNVRILESGRTELDTHSHGVNNNVNSSREMCSVSNEDDIIMHSEPSGGDDSLAKSNGCSVNPNNSMPSNDIPQNNEVSAVYRASHSVGNDVTDNESTVDADEESTTLSKSGDDGKIGVMNPDKGDGTSVVTTEERSGINTNSVAPDPTTEGHIVINNAAVRSENVMNRSIEQPSSTDVSDEIVCDPVNVCSTQEHGGTNTNNDDTEPTTVDRTVNNDIVLCGENLTEHSAGQSSSEAGDEILCDADPSQNSDPTLADVDENVSSCTTGPSSADHTGNAPENDQACDGESTGDSSAQKDERATNIDGLRVFESGPVEQETSCADENSSIEQNLPNEVSSGVRSQAQDERCDMPVSAPPTVALPLEECSQNAIVNTSSVGTILQASPVVRMTVDLPPTAADADDNAGTTIVSFAAANVRKRPRRTCANVKRDDGSSAKRGRYRITSSSEEDTDSTVTDDSDNTSDESFVVSADDLGNVSDDDDEAHQHAIKNTVVRDSAGSSTRNLNSLTSCPSKESTKSPKSKPTKTSRVDGKHKRRDSSINSPSASKDVDSPSIVRASAAGDRQSASADSVSVVSVSTADEAIGTSSIKRAKKVNDRQSASADSSSHQRVVSVSTADGDADASSIKRTSRVDDRQSASADSASHQRVISVSTADGDANAASIERESRADDRQTSSAGTSSKGASKTDDSVITISAARIPKKSSDSASTSESCWHFHVSRFTGYGRKFRCGICDVFYTHWSWLLSHMSRHTGGNTFVCSECWGTPYVNTPPRQNSSAEIVTMNSEPTNAHPCATERMQPAFEITEPQSEVKLSAVNCLGGVRGEKTPLLFAINACLHFAETRFKRTTGLLCGVCGMRYTFWSRFRMHSKVHVNGGPLLCTECFETIKFSTDDEVETQQGNNSTSEATDMSSGIEKKRSPHASSNNQKSSDMDRTGGEGNILINLESNPVIVNTERSEDLNANNIGQHVNVSADVGDKPSVDSAVADVGQRCEASVVGEDLQNEPQVDEDCSGDVSIDIDLFVTNDETTVTSSNQPKRSQIISEEMDGGQCKEPVNIETLELGIDMNCKDTELCGVSKTFEVDLNDILNHVRNELDDGVNCPTMNRGEDVESAMETGVCNDVAPNPVELEECPATGSVGGKLGNSTVSVDDDQQNSMDPNKNRRSCNSSSSTKDQSNECINTVQTVASCSDNVELGGFQSAVVQDKAIGGSSVVKTTQIRDQSSLNNRSIIESVLTETGDEINVDDPPPASSIERVLSTNIGDEASHVIRRMNKPVVSEILDDDEMGVDDPPPANSADCILSTDIQDSSRNTRVPSVRNGLLNCYATGSTPRSSSVLQETESQSCSAARSVNVSEVSESANSTSSSSQQTSSPSNSRKVTEEAGISSQKTPQLKVCHHFDHHQGKSTLRCGVCGTIFSLVRELLIHMAQHNDGKPFPCEQCTAEASSQARSTSNDVSAQSSTGTGSGCLKCPVCQQSFRNKLKMDEHLKVHLNRRQHTCPHCDWTFDNLYDRNQHILLHIKDKPFPCTICSRKFASWGGMKSHVAQHSEEKSFKCTICTKAFQTQRLLRGHQSCHAERKHKCEICSKTYKTSTALSTHLNTHPSVNGKHRSFVCKICDKKFNNQANLNYHAHVHSDVRKFKCPNCDAAFKLNHHLGFHMKKACPNKKQENT